MPQSPIVQQPPTPQYNIDQQQFPQISANESPAAANNRNRQQVARGLQYEDSFHEPHRQKNQMEPQTRGLTIDSFRLLSVLGRGHFGKVILSQYRSTGKKKSVDSLDIILLAIIETGKLRISSLFPHKSSSLQKLVLSFKELTKVNIQESFSC